MSVHEDGEDDAEELADGGHDARHEGVVPGDSEVYEPLPDGGDHGGDKNKDDHSPELYAELNSRNCFPTYKHC